MYVQKLATFGIFITVIIALVLTLLIHNSTQNAKSPAATAPLAIAETFLSNSTNTTGEVHHPENLSFSPSTHPPLLSPQNKSVLEQTQKNRLHGPPLPSSNQSIRGPAPGTASP
jgi:hypothetical protein